MPNPLSKITDALAGKTGKEPKVIESKPAPKAPDAPTAVTAYKEYRDKDSKYMSGELSIRLKRLSPKGMPKRSK